MLTSVGKPFKPFQIIPSIKPVFFIYLVTGITVGQIGILFSLCKNITGINEALTNNLMSGNLYTFSIALLASSITPLLIEFMTDDDVKFKVYKVISIVLIVFLLMLPMSFFFSPLNHLGGHQADSKTMDFTQILFYASS